MVVENSVKSESCGGRGEADAVFPWFPLGMFCLLICFAAFFLFAPDLFGPKPDETVWVGRTIWKNCYVISRVSSANTDGGVLKAEIFFRNPRDNPELEVDLSSCRLFTFNGSGIPSDGAGRGAGVVKVAPSGKMERVVVPFGKQAVLESMNRLYGIRFKIDGEEFNLLGRVFRSAQEADEYVNDLLERADLDVPIEDLRHENGHRDKAGEPK